MSEKKIDFYQDHSINYLEMALGTERQASMENPDGYGTRTGECGDTVEIFLKVHAKKVQAVSYHADGCLNTHACCNSVAEMAEGAAVETTWGITRKSDRFSGNIAIGPYPLRRVGCWRSLSGAFQISGA